MAGDRQVGVYPVGLVGQLGLRGDVGGPHELADTLVPTMSMEHLYAASDVVTTEGQTPTVSAAGSVATITVPQGAAWRIYSVGAILDAFTSAGDVGHASIIVSPPQAAFSCPVAFRADMLATATSSFRFGVFIAQPMVLLPGSAIQLYLEKALVTGTCRLSIRAMYQSLRV